MSEPAVNVKNRRWTRLVLPACILAGLVFLIGLGSWQMKRLAWKESLIARVETNLHGKPSTVREIEAIRKDNGDIEYLPVKVRGRFLHQFEQYYFATHNGASGWFVFTPLERQDGSLVFVNRGYVPPNGKDPATRRKGQIEGQVEIVGLARSAPSEKPNSLVPDNDLEQNIYYWKSISQMTRQTGLKMQKTFVRFFIDADNTANPGGYPLGGVTKVTFLNNHLQYGLTWYGLAVALLVVGGLLMFKRQPDEA